MKKYIAMAVCLMSLVLCGAEKVRLWEKDAPLAKGQRDIDIPTLEVFLPENAGKKTPAVVICPGGAYYGLAYVHEGVNYAKFLNGHGIAGLVLKYRTGGAKNGSYRYPAPQMDAHRAIRFVRANAEKWNIDPQKVGIMGSSAGGHLTAITAVKNDAGDPEAADPVEKFSSRPDFFVLCYAQTSMDKRYGKCCGSRRNLLGDDESRIREVAAYAHVSKNTPPGFIWHTWADQMVPVRNALDMANAMEEHGVPYSLHIYRNGKHGLGLGNLKNTHLWSKELIFWLSEIGILR